MDLRTCITSRLRRDITDELMTEYDEGHIQDVSHMLTRDEFEGTLDQMIPKVFPELDTMMVRSVTDSSEDRCCARVWDRRLGTRCKKRRFQDADFCKQHSEQAEESKLRLGRYDEPKPVLNEKGHLFHWDEGILHLETVFQYQHTLLHRQIVSGDP
jgi:tRNA(Ile)-lysidine synthase TilS/MesJ